MIYDGSVSEGAASQQKCKAGCRLLHGKRSLVAPTEFINLSAAVAVMLATALQAYIHAPCCKEYLNPERATALRSKVFITINI